MYKDQLQETQRIHTMDIENGYGEVYLPKALGSFHIGQIFRLFFIQFFDTIASI